LQSFWTPVFTGVTTFCETIKIVPERNFSSITMWSPQGWWYCKKSKFILGSSGRWYWGAFLRLYQG